MKNIEARKVLLEFAELEHSEENVLFYEKAQSFRSSHLFDDATEQSKAEVMQKEAQELVDQFLKENAEFQVTVASSNPYKKGMPADVMPAANMFDPVCRVVHKSIEQDIFPRFKQSNLAKELLARIPSLAKRFSGNSGTTSNRSTNPDGQGMRGKERSV